ncbi:hypothetical protein Tco_0528455, partial [Tanacetum coccineum]
METIHVQFNELIAMAYEHHSLEPRTNRFQDNDSSAEDTPIPPKEYLDNLFGLKFEEYFEKRPSEVSINSTTQSTLNNQDTPLLSSIIIEDNKTPPLKAIKIDEGDSMSTPMATARLDANLQGTPTDQTKYHSMIGGLISFDVLVGMNRLSKRKFGIVCHGKVVRIPLEGDDILRVHGEHLVPGATPVAKSSCRLAPLEMQELSEQLQELQDEVYQDGVFSTNSFDAEEGGVADYNNLDSTIDVPSTASFHDTVNSQGTAELQRTADFQGTAEPHD